MYQHNVIYLGLFASRTGAKALTNHAAFQLRRVVLRPSKAFGQMQIRERERAAHFPTPAPPEGRGRPRDAAPRALF